MSEYANESELPPCLGEGSFEEDCKACFFVRECNKHAE